MNKRNWIILILSLIVAALLFVLITRKPKTVVKVEIKENLEKIDSLNSVIDVCNVKIDSLQEVKEKIREKVIVRVEELKVMQPDSTLYLFHDNTEKYGELRSDVPVLLEDSSVLCSIDNIRDANIITEKLESEIENRGVLEEEIAYKDKIINSKDSVIDQKDIVLDKTKEAYQKSLDEMAKKVKKEKRKKKTVIVIGSAVIAAVVGGIILK